jgi:acyl carrier protein
MTNMDVLSIVASIIQDVFVAPHAVITRDTQASDVDGWDSLSHAILILRIESAFKIRFPLDDVYKASNVGELIDQIEQLMMSAPPSGK